ncbi:MAG TPA: DPP IV N-terminal domain-containing protein, partial [Vicinamibacterales bacterium]|nr:DPP IV N-terminal domain-containing protein [Vicinamibacterales bacterium]
MRTRRIFTVTAAIAVALVSVPRAQQPNASTPLQTQIDRIFKDHAFDAPRFGPARWLPDGSAYAIVERSGGGTEIARYDAASGARSVLARTDFDVDDYAWSADGKQLLVFTNTKKVWRQNTRGDYYVLDVAAGTHTKLGGSAPEASLMFATFSPDGSRVAYVRQNNLFVEGIATGAITQLTSDGTLPPNGASWAPATAGTIVNGTSDWVNEEELDIRDGFRWSPDGQHIAYWQFD